MDDLKQFVKKHYVLLILRKHGPTIQSGKPGQRHEVKLPKVFLKANVKNEDLIRVLAQWVLMADDPIEEKKIRRLFGPYADRFITVALDAADEYENTPVPRIKKNQCRKTQPNFMPQKHFFLAQVGRDRETEIKRAKKKAKEKEKRLKQEQRP